MDKVSLTDTSNSAIVTISRLYSLRHQIEQLCPSLSSPSQLFMITARATTVTHAATNIIDTVITDDTLSFISIIIEVSANDMPTRRHHHHI